MEKMESTNADIKTGRVLMHGLLRFERGCCQNLRWPESGGSAWERQSPDWRALLTRQSGDWRSQGSRPLWVRSGTLCSGPSSCLQPRDDIIRVPVGWKNWIEDVLYDPAIDHEG